MSDRVVRSVFCEVFDFRVGLSSRTAALGLFECFLRFGMTGVNP